MVGLARNEKQNHSTYLFTDQTNCMVYVDILKIRYLILRKILVSNEKFVAFLQLLLSISCLNPCQKKFLKTQKFLHLTRYGSSHSHMSFKIGLLQIISISHCCFSVRFCDNSLLVLKMVFQFFSSASKKVQEFSDDKKILMSLLSVLFHLQNDV